MKYTAKMYQFSYLMISFKTGENLFMVVNLEKSTEDSIEFAIPSGQWLAPQQQAEGTFLISKYS